jgi:hypothetical protein
VSSDVLDIFLLALLAMFNPSLLAAVTVMLLLPSPKRLMLGYLVGAYTTSITAGLLIVHTLHGSGAASTAKHTVSPLEDIVIGALALTVAFLLHTGRDQPVRERRRRKKEAKLAAKRHAGKPTEPLSLRMLGKGDPKVTFGVGVLLSFPGVSYLVALDKIHNMDPGAAAAIVLVVGFCLIQLMLLEVPLLGYAFAPERTKDRIAAFKDWTARSGRTAAVYAAGAIGLLLFIRGAVTLL